MTIMRCAVIIFILFLIACQEEIELDYSNNKPQLVVDGLITDQPGPYQVKLNLTNPDLSSNQTSIPATGAKVTISDNLGNSEALIEVPKGSGVYQTQKTQGVVGRTYYLSIKHQNQNYSAESTLLPVNKKFQLTALYHEDFGALEEGYYLYYFHRNPDDTVKYYRYYIYQNNSLNEGRKSIWVSPTYYSSETSIAGKRIHLVFNLSDSVKVEIHPLSEEAYKFYTELELFLDYEENIFEPPSVIPTGNISNGGIGIFRASSVFSKEVLIEDVLFP